MFFAKLMIGPLLNIYVLSRVCIAFPAVKCRSSITIMKALVTVFGIKLMTTVGVMMSPVSLRAWQMFQE